MKSLLLAVAISPTFSIPSTPPNLIEYHKPAVTLRDSVTASLCADLSNAYNEREAVTLYDFSLDIMTDIAHVKGYDLTADLYGQNYALLAGTLNKRKCDEFINSVVNPYIHAASKVHV
ncbi:hypothetical protein [Photobacterium damselae]|uniref:hypothetical protein n=1 Tax=Photobacterium damselae TaxID=38293 RepID=UPI001F3B723E|nr:hypothetical protein [Photobacterium damselae]UKA12914.1 hypothetical protein IHC91_21590 [Photobacterium damselae subsp. damselae]